ncbi:tenascin-R-like [Pecten maximus]|uniref:tenascin-R-like n=1 Tax=Pecten maximus TaxID=6579 RepID=UPI001457FEB1|nr:tenascin-R-like [Pecten maximus]
MAYLQSTRTGWIHKIGSTVIRDSFDHVTNLGSMSTLTIPTVSLQDMGMYICEVENGIPGRNGQIVQTGQGFMSVTGSPRVINGREKYVTEKDVSLDINVTFISFPEPVNTSILRTDSSLPPQSDPTVSVSPVPVSVSFYNKDVIVDGYMAQIHFNKFERKYRGHYQLYIRNSFVYYYNFKIVISGKPDSPSNLVISQITENSAVISWIPGEDNGHIQTFTLTYRKSRGELQTNFITSKSSFTVRNLTMSTRYDVSEPSPE